MRSEMKFTVLRRRKLHIRSLVLRIFHLMARLASPDLRFVGDNLEAAELSSSISPLVDSFVNHANLLIQFLENCLLDGSILDGLRKYNELDERTSILRSFNQSDDSASTAVS